MTTRYNFKHPEMIIAGSALIVSLITAFVSIYSAFIDRAYARASVWPRLEISRSYSKEHFFYSVSNKGTGPAVVQYARLSLDDQPVTSWSEYLHKQLGQEAEHVQSHIGSLVISAGENIKPMQIKGTKVALQLAEQDSLSIELCYCSIYNECWLVDRGNNPQPVAQCHIDNSIRFRE